MGNSVKGPKAPTDPEQKRSYFYIMRDKDIYFSKQDDGSGIQFLYQSDGRLESSANVTGGVEDKEILNLLSTVAGFKQVVHSVGVSVELDEKDDEVEFIFQMYGKVDQYGGGSNLVSTLKGDGSEKRIYLKDIEWTEDDNVPGQIKVCSKKADFTGVLSVRLYLNEGFDAPEQDEDVEIDFASLKYKEMIEKSLISTGNNRRIKEKINRALAGERLTFAFIGGSITQGAGAIPINTECYSYKSYKGLEEILGQKVNFVKAGVGGTPSELGMLRFDRDVLRDGMEQPDIVVVEFAVNDEDDETEGDCYESLVRKILKLPNNPAVILLFSVFADDYNLQERLIPVGKRYELPMVSVKNAVTPQFYDKENRILTKNQYFYDTFHPTNLGHSIMADCVLSCIKKIMMEPIASAYEPDFVGKPAIGASFDDIIFMDKKATYGKCEISEGSFTATDDVLQCVEMDDSIEITPEFPYNWMYDGTKEQSGFEPFKLTLKCKRLVLCFKDSGEIDAAVGDVYVDNKFVKQADPYINRWLHCNAMIVIDENEAKEHTFELRLSSEELKKKFTILGFGIVE